MNKSIPYVESIPNNWDLIPNRFLFIYDGKKVGKNYNKYQLLSLTTTGVKKREISDCGGKVPESYENYQTVKIGQMIFCLFDLDCSAVFSGVSNYDGMITSAYDVFSSTKLINSLFADYWFKYVFSNRYYKMYSKNIRYTITSEIFRSIKTPVPPMKIQNKIANFLDVKCAEIDKLIANQQEQIDKLKEYKQSVITEAVTKGLDPTATMKDSGVEWIGDIPKWWNTSRVGLLYEIILGKMLCSSKFSEDYTLEKYYCAANIHFDGISSSDVLKEMWFSTSEKKLYIVNNGDLLVVEGGAGAGGCAIANGITDNIFVQNSVMIVRHKKASNTRYLKYWIESLVRRGYIDVICNKATIPHFTKDKLANTPCAVPPIEEQQQIADYLDDKCGKIDQLIAIKQQKIDKLQQYKKSLIYEYVTGKKEII